MSLQRRSGLVTGPEHTLAKDLDFDRLLYSDFTLVCDGKEYAVHRVILAARSQVFRAIFARQDKVEGLPARAVVEDIQPHVLDILIRYVYTDTIEINQITEEVIVAAEKYKISGLIEKCCDRLLAGISVGNAIKLYLMSYFLGAATKLKTNTMEFIISNYAEIKISVPDQVSVLVNSHPKALLDLFEFQNQKYLEDHD